MKKQHLIISGVAVAVLGGLVLSGRANAAETGVTAVTTPAPAPTPTAPAPVAPAPFVPPTTKPTPLLTARGIRNNNPGNIKKSSSAWVGKVGNDGTFEIFDTPENGIRAMGRLLKTYRDHYGLNTIRGIIKRWTAGDSSTIQNNYVYHIVNKTGIAEHLALLSVEHYAAVVEQMIYFENGQQPYAKNLIYKAVQNGLA